MRQFIIIVIAFVAGAASYWHFSPLFLTFLTRDVPDETDPTLEARLEAQRQVDENRTKQNVDDTEETPAPVVEETAVEPPAAETYGVITRGPFPIVGTPDHPASGHIEIIESPEEKLIHYKDYDGTSGLDLRIYLSKDLEASDVFDLGDARGNAGDLVYGMPLDVDISDYKYVLTWSAASDELFDYAKIK
jgi:hypothetical protein